MNRIKTIQVMIIGCLLIQGGVFAADRGALVPTWRALSASLTSEVSGSAHERISLTPKNVEAAWADFVREEAEMGRLMQTMLSIMKASMPDVRRLEISFRKKAFEGIKTIVAMETFLNRLVQNPVASKKIKNFPQLYVESLKNLGLTQSFFGGQLVMFDELKEIDAEIAHKDRLFNETD